MRLHIQPFTPALLPVIVPASAIDLVENLSYHEIQTFPDNNYGYLDLPTMEAEKLKKKLNGAILKGKKMKIEEARPRKWAHEEEEPDVPAIETIEATIESTARKPKRKRDAEVIRGHSVSPGRIIKRGWTEVKDEKTKRSKKDKSSRISSKYTEKEELLFQTKVPANKKDLVREDTKKNGKKRNANGDVIHEFEKTEAQPSFIRQASSKGKTAGEYIDGKGWVDEDGVVVEGPAPARRVPTAIGIRTTRSSMTKKVSPAKSDPSSDDERTPRPVQIEQKSRASPPDLSDETSSSGSSSSDSDDSIAVSSQASSGKEERKSSPNPNASMHPLEALFKKPPKPASQDVAKPSLEIETSFSFFNQDGDDLEEETVPGTPFSSQDNRSRGHRSAAPTPDTAHPSRYNSHSSHLGSSDEDDDDADEHPATTSQTSIATPSKSSTQEISQEQSAFEKQFWENRGELGRGWKRRRREVQKEKRQRETRVNKRSW